MTESETQDEPSLYFLSTQMQSRHEDQERVDSTVQKLKRFKEPSDSTKRPKIPEKSMNKSKKRKKSAGGRKITSISAFVRETLGNKKIANTQGILDYFTGDTHKMSDFITKIESATAQPHLLSRRLGGQPAVLFSEAEWKSFVEKLKLRFPHLSKKSRKSLKTISKQLRALRQSECQLVDESGSVDERGKIWTQASRQPSSELTTEDIRWLYDLDEDDVANETTIEEPAHPFHGQSCFTLSQVLGESQQDPLLSDDITAGQRISDSGGLVENSEPDMEELSDSVIAQAMARSLESSTTSREATPSTPQNSKPVTIYKFEKDPRSSSHQKVDSNSVDILTSLAFAPTCDTLASTGNLEPEGSPIDSQIEDVFKTPTKWPDHLQISSSPLSAKKSRKSSQSANVSPLRKEHRQFEESREQNEPEFLQDSPTKPCAQALSDVVEIRGHVELAQKSRFILRLLPKELYSEQQEHVSDSEDDAEVSFIGVMKPMDAPSELTNYKKSRSILQVPSSP